MSTKYADGYNPEETINCKICNGHFVPGGVRIELPDHVCIWCFSRSNGAAYRRFMLLWDGLVAMHENHVENSCDCYGCKVYRSAKAVMIPPSETMP